MIRFQRYIVYVLTAALSAGGGQDSVLLPASDVNGDCVANILDLQVIVACVLEGGETETLADVNGDGEVDVRDLQRMVAETNGAREGEMPAPAPAVPATSPAPPRIPLPMALPEAPSSPQPRTQETRRAQLARGEASRVSLQDCERYLYGLMPHAPPSRDAAKQVCNATKLT